MMADSKEETLQVWTNDHATYVARDKDHLRAMYEKHYGESMEYVTGDDEAIQHWHKVPPEKEIVIRLRELNVRPGYT